MNILFDNNTDYEFNTEKINLFHNVVKETLKYENFTDNTEISITIVTNDEIKKINSKFRNIDRPTDVLSFPMIDFANGEIPDFSEIIILGDIIINIDKALLQADEYGHSLERELGFLTAHSMLHLLGYDHMEAEDEKIMFKKQKEILNNVGLKR
ncbi:MAG: rRNA maturation RNase YbeY [Clostridiales bacterium]|nr:rRNA maturation RNase YbeY [Clostridiales bacterium]